MDDMQIESSQINVTELWHKQLFVSLIKVQEYIKISRSGATSIEEALGISPADIPYTQFQYLKQIITELELLLENSKVKLENEWYDKAIGEIKNAQKLIEKYPKEILKYKNDQMSGRKTYYVTDLFYKILDSLKEIRSELVVKLTDILYGVNMNQDKKKKKWD